MSVSLTAPQSVSAYANLAAAVSKVQLFNSALNDSYVVTVSAATGTLFASNPQAPAFISGSGTSTVTMNGSMAQVLNALASLNYINATSGHDTITITANDQTDHSSAATSIDVTVRPSVSFTTVDDPLGPTISAFGINNAGQVVGSFFGNDLDGADGFLYEAGAFTTIKDPIFGDTLLHGINDAATMTGYVENRFVAGHFLEITDTGFVYSDGTFENFEYAGSGNSIVPAENRGTELFFEAINNNDQIAGYYNTGGNHFGDTANYVAFIYQNGTAQTFGPAGTTPFGINDAGQVVGAFTSQPQFVGRDVPPTHGFLYSNGVVSFFDNPSGSSTTARDINNNGLIVGYYQNQSLTHGFAYDQSTETWTTIDVPGAIATFVYGVNDSNQIVGSYTDVNNNVHGFVGAVPPPLPAAGGNVDEWLPVNGKWSASAQPGSHPAGARAAAVADFTGDGTSDILWQNVSTSAVDLWKMSNGAWAGSLDLGTHPGAGWQIAGAGDFNGDGTSDVFWFNATTGGTDIWQFANGSWAGSVSPGNHPLGYQVAGIGDFNRDGTSDVLWFNPATRHVDEWNIVNGHWAGSNDVGNYPDAGFQIAGVGDFNNDGSDDVFWHNPSTGATDIWLLQNGKWSASVSPGNHPVGSNVAGTGDFNGDGTSDALWFNPATGNTEEWLMANGHWAATVDLGEHPGSATIAGVGDFNGSLMSDVLWHQFV